VGLKKEIAEYDRDCFNTIHGFLRKQEISALMDSFTDAFDSVISRENHPGAGGDTLLVIKTFARRTLQQRDKCLTQ